MESGEIDLDAFRMEVRAFLSEHLPALTAKRMKAGFYLTKDEIVGWHKALAQKGWIAMHWPRDYGGTGWSVMQKHVFDEEAARAGAPVIPAQGLNQVGALLINFGSDEQRTRFLPHIYSGEHIWCQGWSEAGAGSDLANLTCKAALDGDSYVVAGTKLWTSAAHRADWCMLLVRTSVERRKQDGVSILLMDMRSKGITIRPIISIDGMHSFNEMILDDVRVPAENRVGDEGKGWPLMRGIILDQERVSASGISKARTYLERLCSIAKEEKRDGRPLFEHPAFRRRLALLEIRTRALHALLLEALAAPKDTWGVLPSILKIRGTQLQQDILEMISEAAGHYGLPFHPREQMAGWDNDEPIGPEFATAATSLFLYMRHLTISGGASEIHRNMIAKGVMG